MKILKSKLGTLLVIIIAFLFMLWNPLAFAPIWTSLYGITLFTIYVFWLESTAYTAQGLTKEDKQYINKEKLKSFFRSVVQIIGALVAAAAIFNFKIPFIDSIIELVNYLSGKVGIAVDALNILIGIGLYLYAFFFHSDRFKTRALIKPRKIHLKK